MLELCIKEASVVPVGVFEAFPHGAVVHLEGGIGNEHVESRHRGDALVFAATVYDRQVRVSEQHGKFARWDRIRHGMETPGRKLRGVRMQEFAHLPGRRVPD